MVSPKAIRDQLITLLTNAKPLTGDRVGIKKWFKGEKPRSQWPGFPLGWVEWLGGVMEPPIGTKAIIRDKFGVVVVVRHVDAETAEDSAFEFVESVEAALDDFPTIGDLVADSWVVNRERQKVFEGDYSMIAIRIVLDTRRRE